MATIANLNILLSLEDQATSGLEKSQRNLQAWGKSIAKVGGFLTATVTTPIAAVTIASVKMASDLAESTSAVEQVYGSAAQTVIDRSIAAAEAVGLSRNEYLSTAAVLGVYGDTLGLTASETADFSNSLITAAADLGSFYNASTPDVLEAMQAALRGEFDPLERFGIMMNQAALEQFALENGIWDGNGALTAQQRILAAQGYIMDHMGDATGDFARTSRGLANSVKILRAQLKNLMAQMGQVLLPIVTKLVSVFQEWVTRFQGLSESWQRWIVIITLAVAAIGPLLLALGTFLTILPLIGAALAVLTGPIGLVIAAIALLTAAYIGNWWGFRDAVNGVAGAVWDALNALWGVEAVRNTVTSALDAVRGAFDRVTEAVSKFGNALKNGDWRTALAAIGDALAAPAKAIGEFIKGIETGFAPIDRLLTNIGNMFTDFGRIIQELFQGDFSGALEVFKRAIGRIPEIVRGAFDLIPWASIGAAIVSAIQGLPSLISDVTSTLKQVGIDLLVGVLAGLNEYMPTVTAWLGLVGSIAWAAVGGLASTLLDKGRELLQGVLDGLNGMMPTVTAWLSLIGSVAVGAVGSLSETLYAAGADLIGGALGGAKSMIGFFESEIGGLGGKALSAVGDLSTTLYSAGADLIGGFLGGIKSLISDVKSEITGLIDWIPETVKNLLGISSPSKVFMEIGGFVGEGLAIGLERSIPDVIKSSHGLATAALFDPNGTSISLRTGSPFAAAMNVTGAFDGDDDGGRGVTIHAGIYNEADRYWAPEQTLRARGMQARRR